MLSTHTNILQNKHSILPLRIFSAICLIYLYMSSYSWIRIFLFSPTQLCVCISILLIGCMFMMHFKPRNIIPFLNFLMLLAFYSIWQAYIFNSLTFAVLSFFSYLPAGFLFILPTDQKRFCLNFITKWYAILLSISIAVYLVTLVVNVPPFSIFIQPENDFYPHFKNYIFYIDGQWSFPLKRFNAMFLEPGHQAMISALLLFANKYNLKNNKYLYILVVAIAISFSLAGWVITLIGLLLLKLKSIKSILILTGIVFITYVIATNYNDGNNLVNELIIERLQFDESKGIAGNNRFAGNTDNAYRDSWKTGEIIKGVGNQNSSRNIIGAGYKIFLLRNGLISAIFTLCIYFCLIGKQANKLYAMSFIFLLALTFLQRSYPTWFSWLLPFVLGVNTFISTQPKQKIKASSPTPVPLKQ